MSNLLERLDHLRALIQEPEFLEGKGLSNEVNIRIFCYDPKDEMTVRHFTEKLMCDQDLNCRLIEYNLYHVFLSICDDKRITDRVAQQEEKKGKQFILDQMLLKKCILEDDDIFLSQSLSYGQAIQIGNDVVAKELPDRRNYARWEAAIEECLNAGFLKKHHSGYSVTDSGYRYIENNLQNSQ